LIFLDKIIGSPLGVTSIRHHEREIMPNPYYQRRQGTYYLRLRIPTDMRAVLGVQIIRSLRTGRAEEARSLAAGMVSAAPRCREGGVPPATCTGKRERLGKSTVKFVDVLR
jgi:hypothetical protein